MRKYFKGLPPLFKGIGLAFIATLGMANVYVFSKAAMMEVNFFQFQFYWFAFGLFWLTIYLAVSKKLVCIKRLKRKSIINLGIIGLLEVAAAMTMFLAISLAENPATVSFLSNATPIFVTLFGIKFLHERFSLIEALGIVLTIGGVILISATKNTSISEFFGQGSGWILISSLFGSISIVFAKKIIGGIHPGIFAVNRVFYIFVFAVMAILLRQESLQVSNKALVNLAAGSFLGPFLTALAQYSALRFIEASRTMIIQATRGLFVLIGSMLYLSIMPTTIQIVGGSITVIGVIVMTLGKMKNKSGS